MRAFVYLRQSLDRTGSGAAVDRQRQDCLKLCAERGWDVVRTYVDNDVSASSRKPRPQYTAMLKAIEAGETDVVVAWHVDRLTRKLTDLEHLIELAQNTGLRIATVTGDVDLSTDAGRLVGRILASVARGEVERKGARQKRAQQQAAQQGRPAGGRRAFGYTSDGMGLVAAEAELVRDGYRHIVQGGSLKSLARDWNDAGFTTTACKLTPDHATHKCAPGEVCNVRTDHTKHQCLGRPWRHDNVREVLKNPRYAGLRTYRGEIVGPAVWPALVDRETFEAAAAILGMPERRTTASTARKYLLPNLAVCGKCGAKVTTGYTQHGKRVYRCRAGGCITRKAEPVDALIAGGEIEGVPVRGVVVERLSRPDAIDLLSADADAPEVKAAKVSADAIRQRLDDLATGLEEGILTLQAVRASSERLRAELAKVEQRITDGTHADVLGPLVTAADVEAAWASYDLAQRRQVIDALMTITLLSPERGVRAFDPESVRVEWKG